MTYKLCNTALIYLKPTLFIQFNVVSVNTCVVSNDPDIYFHVIIHRKIEVENLFYDGCGKCCDVVGVNNVVYYYCKDVVFIFVVKYLFNGVKFKFSSLYVYLAAMFC